MTRVYAALAVLVVLCFLIGGILIKWSAVEGTFWKVSFTDALGIVVTLLVGYFIAVVVNEQLAAKAKKRDIVLQLLERLQRTIQEAHRLGDAYMRLPTSDQEGPILRAYTKADNQLLFLRKLGNKKLHSCPSLRDGTVISLVHEHNLILTGTRFRSAHPAYSEADVLRYETAFQAIDEKIDECKMDLFE